MAKKKIVKKVAPKTPEVVKAPAKKVLVKDASEGQVLASVQKNIGAEANNSGAPKNFVIRCSKCCWSRPSSGLAADLTDIHEIKPNCKTCGKWRKFFCPKCGSPSMMKRIKGNA